MLIDRDSARKREAERQREREKERERGGKREGERVREKERGGKRRQGRRIGGLQETKRVIGGDYIARKKYTDRVMYLKYPVCKYIIDHS